MLNKRGSSRASTLNKIQFSFVENLEQTNPPTDYDSDRFSSIYYLLIIFPLIYSQFLSNYLQLNLFFLFIQTAAITPFALAQKRPHLFLSQRPPYF